MDRHSFQKTLHSEV